MIYSLLGSVSSFKNYRGGGGGGAPAPPPSLILQKCANCSKCKITRLFLLLRHGNFPKLLHCSTFHDYLSNGIIKQTNIGILYFLLNNSQYVTEEFIQEKHEGCKLMPTIISHGYPDQSFAFRSQSLIFSIPGFHKANYNRFVFVSWS